MIGKLILITFGLVWSNYVAASCPELYPNGINIEPRTTATKELCNSFYVVHFDQATTQTVFVSELLQPGTPIGAVTRLSSFRSDSRVQHSPKNSDFKGTQFDRGHLVPAEDASTLQQMYDTFYLTNVVPQDPTLNRGKWKQLEAKIRTLAVNSKVDTYVVTIPVYPAQFELLSGNVPIPTGIWKIVFTGLVTRFYYADNSANVSVKEYSKINWTQLVSN